MIQTTEQLGVDGDDHGGKAHEQCRRGRGQDDPGPGQSPGGQRNCDHVVARSPPKVLNHLAAFRPGKPVDTDHPPGVVGGEDDPSRLDGDISPRADGDPDIGLRQCRSIVNSVPHHGYPQSPSLELSDLGMLSFGEDLGEHLVNFEFRSDGLSHLLGIAGDHGNLHPQPVELVNGFP